MALSVASVTPLPEAGLLFRKPMGMVWAKGGTVGGNGNGTGVNTEVSSAPPSWDCVVPAAEAGVQEGGGGATHVSMKRLCHKPAALYAVPGQQLVRGHQPTSVLSLFFSSLKDPHQLRSLQLPL